MTRQVRVTWDAVPRSTQYEIQYRIVGDLNWSASLYTSTNSIVLNLEEGQSYQFRGRPVCGTDVGDWASLGIPVYSADGTCNSPMGITVEQLPDTYNYKITWAAAAGISSWNFRYRRTGDLTWTTATVVTPMITISSLVVGASYEFQVQTVCAGSTTSEWSNTGIIDVQSSTDTQSCPITYDEEFSGTLAGRKDGVYVVTLTGNLVYTPADPPAVGDFVIAGYIGLCCAPAADVTVPVTAAGFTGELTISAAGQLTLYVDTLTGSTPLTISLAGLSYQGFSGTCPPVEPDNPDTPGSNQISGVLSITCGDHGCTQQGIPTISITFPAATPAALTMYIGYLDHIFSGTRYAGANIFSPPAGSNPVAIPNDAHNPFVLNVPAGVTSFTTSGNIYVQGHAGDGNNLWLCHSCQTPITDLYVKIGTPTSYIANFTLGATNYSGLTLHNV